MADAAPPSGGKVNVPGVGKVKPVYILAGVGGVLLLIVLKNRNSGSAAAGAAAAGQSTDPAGNVGVIDPATGYVYGSPQDQAALATSAGSSAAGSGGDTGTGNVGSQVTNGPPFTSNAAWSQYAITILTGNGYDAGTLTDELGMYLAGAAVTPLQEDDINAAIAVANYPPVAGPNGYPPAINVNGSKQGGGSGSGSGSGSGPGPGPGSSAGRLNQPQGVRLVLQYTNSVRLQWDEVQGATGYVVQAKKGGPNGQVVNGPFGTTLALANIGGLQTGTQYTALIWPSDTSDTGGPGSNQPHAEFSFSTK